MSSEVGTPLLYSITVGIVLILVLMVVITCLLVYNRRTPAPVQRSKSATRRREQPGRRSTVGGKLLQDDNYLKPRSDVYPGIVMKEIPPQGKAPLPHSLNRYSTPSSSLERHIYEDPSMMFHIKQEKHIYENASTTSSTGSHRSSYDD